MKKTLLTLLLGTTIFAAPAMANDHEYHGNHDHHGHHHKDETGFYGHLDATIYITDIYNAAEADEEVSNIFSHSHFDGGYRFDNNWSVNGSIKLEGDPAGHSHGGGADRTGNRFFDDHPLVLEQLTVNYDTHQGGGYFGKFNPVIGRDIHDVPGWFGMLIFEEFDIKERIGAGGYFNFGNEAYGQHRLDVSTFFADTTFLSESLLYDRDTLDGEDNGPANTEDFSSYALNLSGNLPFEDVAYYIGYASQANDDSAGDDEQRFTLGLDYHYDINDKTRFNIFGDVTDINHLDGEADHERRYSSVGFGITYDQWVMGGSYTDIHNTAGDADEAQDDYQTQISVGYNFMNGFGIDLGYQAQEEEGEASDRIGTLLRYHADF
jgi:hypothetical protein